MEQNHIPRQREIYLTWYVILFHMTILPHAFFPKVPFYKWLSIEKYFTFSHKYAFTCTCTELFLHGWAAQVKSGERGCQIHQKGERFQSPN